MKLLTAVVAATGALVVVTTSASVLAETPIERVATTALHVPGYVEFLAAEGRAVWTTNDGGVEKLEHDHAAPTASVAMPRPCGAPIVAYGAPWAADCSRRAIARIDLASHGIVAWIETGLADPDGELGLAAGAGAIWIPSDARGTLLLLLPAIVEAMDRAIAGGDGQRD